MSFEIANMLRPEVYDHPVKDLQLIETHISWVILTGDFVYKIKKPVDFGFLDFSTLEKRRVFCAAELRLNRRLAADIYLDVVAIAGTFKTPIISTTGKVVEYAVKMRQFAQSAQLDHMLAAGKLDAGHMEAIALMVADFHQTIPMADASMAYGNKVQVYHPVAENFKQINQHLDTALYAESLTSLQIWNVASLIKLGATLAQRKANGFVRECHGDMHLRNLAWLERGPIAFDCIEFNPQLRWIDVISDIAFLVMDLQQRKNYQLASRFLNSYLEITGDYAGLSVLSFYLCYRAMVRAKVAALLLAQDNISKEEKKSSLAAFESYLELARSYTLPASPKLIIMRGLSASGKSTVAKKILEILGAIRLRSDVERKRLFNIAQSEHASAEMNAGIYSTAASQQTYEKLRELAEQIINSGYSVIVDAAFLQHEHREPFQNLALQLNVCYVIVEVTAPVEVLQQRMTERINDVSDADLSVLKHQLSNWQTLDENEVANTVTVDTEEAIDTEKLVDMIIQQCD